MTIQQWLERFFRAVKAAATAFRYVMRDEGRWEWLSYEGRQIYEEDFYNDFDDEMLAEGGVCDLERCAVIGLAYGVYSQDTGEMEVFATEREAEEFLRKTGGAK